jgi:hypothetical protein
METDRLYRHVSIADLQDGKAIRVTDYWGEPVAYVVTRGAGFAVRSQPKPLAAALRAAKIQEHRDLRITAVPA